MKKCFVPFALVIATLYLTLSVGAVTCLFAHESQPGSAHHHKGGATHSSLCAWACDANPTVDFSIITPQTQPLHLVSMLPLVESSVSHLLSQQSAHSRAPPHS
ncbi:MAG: hypothetical protein E8D46_14420 [Nitrospira sp.]|nr:MAG: hypothetical protein E8D46_14420 [Nitrospira sp.]